MRVEGCRLKNVTFILGEMRERESEGEGGVGAGWEGRGWGAVVDGWLEEALEQLFKS